MKQVISVRKPKGAVLQRCAGCGRYIKLQTNGSKKATPLVFVKTYTNAGKWRSTEVFHAQCHPSGKEHA